jgi:broad specificity phosphatase PhoE
VEVTFVRHAESEANVAGRWQGHGDAHLSTEGRRQAGALAERLQGTRFDLVVASDLTRAADTARAVHADVTLDAGWREVDVGAWEGLTREEVVARYPDEVRALQRGADVPIGGGESWSDLLARVREALARLRATMQPGQRAMVVTHGGVIHALTSHLMHLSDRRPRPIGRVANTATTTLRFSDGMCELTRFNDASHLGGLGPWARERLEAGDAVFTLVESEAVAAQIGVPIAARADGDLSTVLTQAAGAHRGRRVGLLCRASHVATYTSALFGHGAGGPARVAAPDPHGCGHLVISDTGATVADYNRS